MSDIIIFDLDGTLTDPREGMTKSVQYALRYFGIIEPDLWKLESFIGPPLKEEFMRRCGFDSAMGDIAVGKYRDRYIQAGIYENKVINGVVRMLDILVRSGKTLAVVSSKPAVYVEKILCHLRIRHYFAVVVGSDLDGSRGNKADAIGEVLRRFDVNHYTGRKNPDRIVMVGDREHDIYGAKAHSIPCIGVLYGFGSRAELEKANATYIAESIDQLLYQLMNIDFTVRRKENLFVKLWRCVYPVGIHYGLLMGVAIISFLIIALVVLIVGYSSGSDIYGDSYRIYARYISLMTALGGAASIPIFWHLYKKDRKREKEQLTFKKMQWVEILMVMGLAIVTCVGISNLIVILGIYELFPQSTDSMSALYEGFLLEEIICIGIVVPIAEELLFRGLVYKRIKAYTNVKIAAVLTSLFFGIYHMNVPQGIYACILSLIIIYALEKCNTMIAPILIHATANTTAVLMNDASFLSFIYSSETIYLIATVIAIAIAITIMYYLNVLTGRKKIIEEASDHFRINASS